MNVKCIDTGEKLDRDVAYKVVVNGRNKYYSSEEGYKKFESDKEYKNKIIDLIREYLGYKPQMKLPTLTYKKIEDPYRALGLDVLYYTLVNQRNNIEWALKNKQFTSEIAKINYVFGILQNNYMDEYKKKVAETKAAKYHVKSELEDIAEIETIDRKQAVKDLREFIDED